MLKSVICATAIFIFAAHADASDMQMMPPTDFNAPSGACSQGGALFWDTSSPVHCIPGVLGDAAGDLTVSRGDLTAARSLIVGTTNVTEAVVSLASLPQCPTGFFVTSLGGGRFACAVTHMSDAAPAPAAFNPASCHIVSNIGGPPSYVSDARCGPGEFVLNGGGVANQNGFSICPASAPAGDQARPGFIHTSLPDADLQGWNVDAYAADGSGDTCTQAYAVCCSR